MCFGASNIKNISKYNWEGDVIIQQPIVPSGRRIIGSRKSYDIDVREYLASNRNAVMERAVRETIPRYLRKHGGSVSRFVARERGSFDYRSAVITNFVADTIAYKSAEGRDPWQFPDETLVLKTGDCEDRAFLLAALLLASGVSPFSFRVAFGKMMVGDASHDHMWVMYKSERGYWAVIEPLRLGKALADEHLPAVRQAVQPPPTVEYVPRFLFNDSHLWAVRGSAEKENLDRFLRRDWKRLNPKFAGEVHLSIIEEAIGAVPGVPSWVLKELKRNFSRLFLAGPLIDSIDLNIPDYSPLDHFDNGYIGESWQQVAQNLAVFRQDNRAGLQAFARAAHAIADFYAHTSYVHFATLADPETPQGHAELYNDGVTFDSTPSYLPPSTFDLTDPKFTVNDSLWSQGKDAAARRWSGQLISGRYAQPHDTQAGLTNHLTEGITRIPAKLRNEQGFSDRGSLPHHNQIAVDDTVPGAQHCLYSAEAGQARMSFDYQLKWRKNTAILHVRKAFTDNFAF
ncbi:MAG TPA: transglutaminase domain-containing protein [Acidobacteriota bacterium]|nr:transglutaminase domain-containing protein [Acidobacteriota bacterium]